VKRLFHYEKVEKRLEFEKLITQVIRLLGFRILKCDTYSFNEKMPAKLNQTKIKVLILKNRNSISVLN
jgi:hypothetical protein